MTATTPPPGPVRDRTDPVPDIDLADPDPERMATHDRVLAGLRSEHAVFWHAPKSRPGFWAVVRYAETLAVYRDPATFSATHGMTLDTLREGPDPASGMMVELTDPPDHRRLRRSVAGLFADGAVAELDTAVDAHVRRVLADVRERGGEVDFVRAVAAPVPTHAAGLLLGIPADDLDWVTGRTARVFLSGRPDAGEEDLRAEAEQANGELLGYFSKLLRSGRRGAGAASFVERLAAGTPNREGLSPGEVVLNALNLAIGGTTTTRALLGNLAQTLAGRPEVLRGLREDPAAVPTAVEEAVRWANPVRHLTRVATRDVELGGVHVRAGDPVVVWPRSANRDERVFPEPDAFDLHRHPNPHIGFAAGPHGCPGTGLGRAQVRAMLRHLAAMFEAVETTGPPEVMQSNFLHGYTRLPVRLRSRTA